MTTPFHQSIICPTLFGRSTELAVIESRLQVARVGREVWCCCLGKLALAISG